MKKINSLDDVLNQIEDLKSSFKFSNELFPIVKDLFVFLKDMIPLLMQANISIKESTDRLPTATDNIENVSKMTETSTNQVLDTIDSIVDRLNSVTELVKSGENKEKQIAELEDISTVAGEIVFAFQFQDITTQKLEHTNRILKTVHEKFGLLFQSFEKMRMNSELGSDVARALEREFEKESRKGLETSEEFKNETADIMHSTEVSQDDIDSFFK